MAALYEKYSVKTWDDLLLPQDYINVIEEAFEDKRFDHFIFHSDAAGVGKTSLANAIAARYKRSKAEFSGGTSNSTKAELEDNIKAIALRMHNFGKICIINEAHRMTKVQQSPLVGLIDDVLSKTNTALCLTTNSISAIDEPLRSRAKILNFDYTNKAHREEMLVKFKTRLIEVIEKENIQYTDEVVTQILHNNFPSLRDMLNQVEYINSTKGNLLQYEDSVDTKINALSVLKNYEFNEAYTILATNGLINDRIYGYVTNPLKTAKVTPVVSHIIGMATMHNYYHGIAPDKELNIFGFLHALSVYLRGGK